ncbi:MAG: hypothetical protein ACM3MD_05515 [Betaproteobacteria bacterium]
MSRRRKIIILTSVLALIVVAGLIFLWTNINWIVKSAIEHYGSQTTRTSVRVASVSIKLAQGKGTIEGLTVANPKGYTAAHVLSLGSISVRIVPSTVTSTPVVIDDIRISAPQIIYEMDSSGTANVDVLKKNIASSDSAPKRPADKKKPGKETRLRIKKLVIENGRVDASVAVPGSRPQAITLKRIEMTDIGGQAGATPEQVAKQVLSAIVSEVSREVAEAGAKRLLEKGLERAVEQMQRK